MACLSYEEAGGWRSPEAHAARLGSKSLWGPFWVNDSAEDRAPLRELAARLIAVTLLHVTRLTGDGGLSASIVQAG